MCVKTNVVSEMVPNMADTMKKKWHILFITDTIIQTAMDWDKWIFWDFQITYTWGKLRMLQPPNNHHILITFNILR